MSTIRFWSSVSLVGVGLALGTLAGSDPVPLSAQQPHAAAAAAKPGQKHPQGDAAAPGVAGANDLKQTGGRAVPADSHWDYGLGDGHISKLLPYPQPCPPGQRTPFDLWRYGGRGPSSWGPPTLHMPWDEWKQQCEQQKPQLMSEVQAYMQGRYDFHGGPIPDVMMSGGRKPVPAGPVARLPEGISSFEELSAIPVDELRERDLFAYKPLAHPLQSTAHMLFPQSWIAAHPEHERFDVDFDIPDAYLPEFPPPMFLTNHKEFGDVTGGREVTLNNYYEIFDGLLTGEQMEGLKELLRPSPTTWFNHTHHRVTAEPGSGVACFSCHVNGHTNGAIELAPDSRPNEARLRVDTPSMRGNFNLMQLSSKRSIRSMDHFAEVEEYFDGDPGLQQAIGPRGAQRQITNRMGDFNAILDFPPAPKLGPLMKLIPQKASAAELRGEQLFHFACKAAKFGHRCAVHDRSVLTRSFPTAAASTGSARLIGIHHSARG